MRRKRRRRKWRQDDNEVEEEEGGERGKGEGVIIITFSLGGLTFLLKSNHSNFGRVERDPPPLFAEDRGGQWILGEFSRDP